MQFASEKYTPRSDLARDIRIDRKSFPRTSDYYVIHNYLKNRRGASDNVMDIFEDIWLKYQEFLIKTIPKKTTSCPSSKCECHNCVSIRTKDTEGKMNESVHRRLADDRQPKGLDSFFWS